jgi:glycosyltransferase involved in cell wall biosynthesis
VISAHPGVTSASNPLPAFAQPLQAPMRIAVVSHACTVPVNQSIYRELEALGHDLSIIAPSWWRHEYESRRFRPRRLPGLRGRLVSLPVARPGSIALHVYRAGLSNVLRSLAPDVLYIEEEPYSIAAFQWARAATRVGIPSVFYTSQTIAKRYPLPFRLTEARVWAWTKGGVCCSSSVVDALRQRGYHGIADVVPFSVDVSMFTRREPDPELARTLSLRPRTIGFLGRLAPEKGVSVLLDAYRMLPESLRKDTSLLFLGDGALAAQCRAEPAAIVHPVAHLDVHRYLPLLDVLAMPSLSTPGWREQFGRAAIEAMACGVPVVGSDSGEIPQLLARTGGGVAVPEGDAAALAEALQSVLTDVELRERLARAGEEGTAAHFSTRRVAGELHQALRGARDRLATVTYS